MNKSNFRIQNSVKHLLRWFFHLSATGPNLFSLQGNNDNDDDVNNKYNVDAEKEKDVDDNKKDDLG